MNSVLCFGEILIRQQALGNSFFEQNNNLLRIFPGGSEANVATTLAQMGTETTYVSAFPDNALSTEIQTILNSLGVDTSKVISSGDRIGSYILLSANGLTKGEVIYDRKYSSFSLLTQNQLDFDKLFQDVSWFHWTALTPALNEGMAILMKSILVEAEERGITISVDLNYRNRLWQYGKEPIEMMPTLIEHCDVLMGNIWASNKMLGTSIDESFDRQTPQEDYVAFSKKSATEVFTKFPKVKHIANTFRFMDSATHNYFYGTYHTPEADALSTVYETNNVVDRIGSGDAFMGGLIHALKNNNTPQEIINIATGAGYQKLFVQGDFGNGQY